MSDYNAKLLSHFQNPKNIGIIENPDGYAMVENPINGYVTSIYLKINNDIIQDVKVKSMGCVVTIASASAISQIIREKNISELLNGEKNIYKHLAQAMENEIGQIPEKNWHCLPTAITVFLTALLDYYSKTDDITNQQMLKKTLSAISQQVEITLQKLGEKG